MTLCARMSPLPPVQVEPGRGPCFQLKLGGPHDHHLARPKRPPPRVPLVKRVQRVKRVERVELLRLAEGAGAQVLKGVGLVAAFCGQPATRLPLFDSERAIVVVRTDCSHTHPHLCARSGSVEHLLVTQVLRTAPTRAVNVRPTSRVSPAVRRSPILSARCHFVQQPAGHYP